LEEKSLQRQGGVAKGVHKVYLNARKSAVMSGVKDVLSFDAKEVYLETEQGVLLIKGDELHVNREKGEVDVDGRIDSFAYSDVEEAGKKAASFLGRLFQ
jgi:sporulation protein YabP